MLNDTRLFKLQSNYRNTWQHIYHRGKATSCLSGFGCCLIQPQEHVTSEAHPSVREVMSPSCPSLRQLEMELGCPGTLLPLSIPDLWAAQPGYWQLVQGFDFSYTIARSQVSWKVVLQSTGKSLNSIFAQKWLNSLTGWDKEM